MTLRVRSTPLQGALLRDILKVGGLACISPLQTVLITLILTRLVAQFGTAALAGYGVGTWLEFLLVPLAVAIGVASIPLVGMAIGAGRVAWARRAAWLAAALATGLLGALGLVPAVAPDVWTARFTRDPAVLASAALYFRWAGPCHGLFGLGLCLYFSSLGAGKVGGPVLAGTLRLLMVAVGGTALAAAQAPAWTIFTLVAVAMAAFGLGTVVAVHVTSRGVARSTGHCHGSNGRASDRHGSNGCGVNGCAPATWPAAGPAAPSPAQTDGRRQRAPPKTAHPPPLRPAAASP